MESMDQNITHSSFTVENLPNIDSQVPFGLLSLRPDQVHQILQWLPLDDLCSMSQTCRFLQRITVEYFHSKYQTKRMQICGGTSDQLYFLPNENVVWCLHPCITNVEFGPFDFDMDGEEWFKFISSNVCDYVKNIAFNQCIFREAIDTTSTATDRVVGVFENVETLEFNRCGFEKNVLCEMVQRFKQIKNLTIIEEFNDTIDELLLMKFPTLEHVKFEDIPITMKVATNMKIFLEQNSNIKTFTWLFTYINRDVNAFIKTILDGGTNLEELFLSFGRNFREFPEYFDVRSICNELQTLSQRKTFKRLELEFKSKVVDTDALASLKFLNGLHLDYEITRDDYLRSVDELHNLEILSINSIDWSLISYRISASNLINLEELIIGELDGLGCISFLKEFILHCPKLKTVKIIKCHLGLVSILLSEKYQKAFNWERSELAGASEMTVFLKPPPKCKLTNNSSDFNFRFVNVKCVDFDVDYFFHVKKGFNYWSVRDN